MRYIYHYHAIIVTYKDRIWIDGILDRARPILNMEDYRASKDEIRELLLHKDPGSTVTIHSLAFLHTIPEPE
jgi:hypothetical protein